MHTAPEILAIARPFISPFFASLGTSFVFDVGKSTFTIDATGTRRSGRFLKLNFRYRKSTGKLTTIATQTIHEYTSSELEPAEAIIKQVEAMLAGSTVSITPPIMVAPVSPVATVPIVPPAAPPPAGTIAAPVAIPQILPITGAGFPLIIHVTENGLAVRAAPNTTAPLAGSQRLNIGDLFTASNFVIGENVSDESRWWVSQFGHYVWSGGTQEKPPSLITPPPVAPPPVPPAAIIVQAPIFDANQQLSFGGGAAQEVLTYGPRGAAERFFSALYSVPHTVVADASGMRFSIQFT